MTPETTDTKSGNFRQARLKRRFRRVALATTLVAFGAVIGAGIVWSYRAPILEWAIKNRIEAAGASAALSVAVFDIDRLTVNNVHIGAPVDTVIQSLRLEYDIHAFLSGKITAIRASGVRLKHKERDVEIERIVGAGAFAIGFAEVRLVQADLDILRATVAGEPIDPARLTIAYRDSSFTVEAAVPSSRGNVALLAEGSLTGDAPPFRVTLSGRLDSALIPFLAPNPARHDTVSFTLNAAIAALPAWLGSIRRGARNLPPRFSVDGRIELDLGRLVIAGHSLDLPGRDRVRFRFEDMRTRDTVTRGNAAIDLEIGSREHRGISFAGGNVSVEAGLELSGDRLELALKPGSEARLVGLHGPNAVRLDGETAFRLLEDDNHVSFNLIDPGARHRLRGRLIRADGQLNLRSEGDLSAPEDPIVFTLQGKIDTAPILALLPDVRVRTGSAEIFVAGEVAALLPQRPSPGRPLPVAATSLRLDGAATLRVKGASLPGIAKTDTTADRITLTLKNFEAARDWRRGRFSISAQLAPRRLGAAEVQTTAVFVDGQLRTTAEGFRFQFEPGSSVQLSNIRSPLLTVPDTLRLQLSGKANAVETDARFRPTDSQLHFAHVEAHGALIGRDGRQEPFRLSLPMLTGAYGENGQEYRAKEGSFSLPGLAVAARDVSLAARVGTNEATATVIAGDVRHRARRPLVSPVSISANAVLRNRRVKLSIETKQLRTSLKAKTDIAHDFDRNIGRMRFTVPRFDLETRKYRFGDMFPVAVGWFDTIRGGATVEGELNWDRELLSGHASIAADQVDLGVQDVRISKLTGTMDFIELTPLLMPPRQRFTGSFAFSDIGPLPFRLEFQLNEDGSISVQDLDIKVAEGRMRTRGVVAVRKSGLSAAGHVSAKSIALDDALRILGLDGLEGSGRVSGTFPIALRNNAARITGGRLIADGPGELHYRGGTLERRLIGDAESKAELIRALSDFRFDALSVELDKAYAGTGTVVLRVNGHNPAVDDGSPFTLNMRVASDLRRLERLALGGLRTAADVSRQADRPAPTR